MTEFRDVFSLVSILFICTFDGYSMMDYRPPAKLAYICFAAVTALCVLVNSYIAVRMGIDALKNMIFFTIGLPYFALILIITRDKISQTVFSFWLWINIYEIIANFTAFINDCTVRDYWFLTWLRIICFTGYFFLYKKFLKSKHRSIMENLDVNWWVFSFIPLFFTVLIVMVNYYFGAKESMAENYRVLFVIHTLMLLVYLLIFYTFKTVHDSMTALQMAEKFKDQIELQKKQYEFYLEKEEEERIYRHDARHRDAILLGCIERGDISGAAELLKKELSEIESEGSARACENPLVNAVIMQSAKKAREKGVDFSFDVNMPKELSVDEAEFTVMLSNILENSLDAAEKYIKIIIKSLNSQLSVSVKNDYSGKVLKDSSGGYLSSKEKGSGLGLKSVAAIVKKNGGFLEIRDSGNIFSLSATLKN